MSHKRTFLIGFGICIAYFFDVALIFRTSIQSYSEIILSEETFFTITNPAESVFYGMLLIGGLWLLFTEFVNTSKYWALLAATTYASSSAFVFFFMKDNATREFWFFTMRTLHFALLIVFIAVFYAFKTDKIQRLLLNKHYILYVGMIFLTLGQLLWNIHNILIAHGVVRIADGVYILPERNFIENAFFLFIAFYLATRGVGLLRVHFDSSPQHLSESQLVFIKEEANFYAQKHSLSPREKEVLILIIEGAGNQQIANILFINQATVKVHVRNIFKKTNMQNRNELIADFWHSV
ncbi:helix-turn-helix transcriptional regulator [Actinomyces sp. zg-332]|uniref:helix-turn-helix transcriptional regulator n=1 Tax=Actinomyces sp. zg-332 TaxID=2708340 RepID=UPI0018C2D702|nr:helix-turn-helix transcriptional regulator [Actinomyces sp. zg-332]